MFFCYANPKRKESAKCHCFSNVFENILIYETMFSAIFQKFASFRSRRFPKPRISTVFRRAQKNTSKVSRKSTENRKTKEWAFIQNDLKSVKSTVFGRRMPKEWDLIFYQLYRFQKMPKRIRPLFHSPPKMLTFVCSPGTVYDSHISSDH